MKGWLKWSAVAAVATAWLVVVLHALVRPEPGNWYLYHMSFHEKWYPSVIRGEVVDRWLPPGYVLAAKFVPFGSLVVKLRLVSLLACGGLVMAVGMRSWRTAALVASTPLLLVFGARSQPDALMLALGIGGALLARDREAHFTGGLLVGLSAFVKPVGLLAVLAVKPSARWLAGVGVGALPFAAWLAFNPESLALHAGKSLPFENLLRFLFIAPFVAGPSFLLTRPSTREKGWMVFAVVAVVFALAKAPFAHEYYLLPAMVGWHLVQDEGHRFLWLVVAANAYLGVALALLLGSTVW